MKLEERLKRIEKQKATDKEIYIATINFRKFLTDSERIYKHGQTITNDAQLIDFNRKLDKFENEYTTVLIIDGRLDDTTQLKESRVIL